MVKLYLGIRDETKNSVQMLLFVFLIYVETLETFEILQQSVLCFVFQICMSLVAE